MKIKLNEYEYKLFKKFLMEDAESDSQKMAIKYAVERLGMDKEEATDLIKKKFRMEIQYLNGNRKAGKFTMGAFRLYMDFTTQREKDELNNALEKICNDNELYKKYDKNLNNLDLIDLVTEVNSNFKGEIEKKSNLKSGNYKIVKIRNFDESSEYSKYTSWCITKQIDYFNRYTDNEVCQFYFLLNEGFEELDEKSCSNQSLLGEYGLSMLAVCINPNGTLKSCTCRWNHDKGGNDHILTKNDIQNLIGKDKINEIFVPNKSYIESQEMINQANGLSRKYELEDIFGTCRYAVFGKNIVVCQLKHDKLKFKFLVDFIDGKSKVICENFYILDGKNKDYLLINTDYDNNNLYDMYDIKNHKYLRKNIEIYDVSQDFITYIKPQDTTKNENNISLFTNAHGFVNKDINGEIIKFNSIRHLSENLYSIEIIKNFKTSIKLYDMDKNAFKSDTIEDVNNPYSFKNIDDGIIFFDYNIRKKNNETLHYINNKSKKDYCAEYNFSTFLDSDKLIIGHDGNKSSDLNIINLKNLKFDEDKIVPNLTIKNILKFCDLNDFTSIPISQDYKKFITYYKPSYKDTYTVWDTKGELISDKIEHIDNNEDGTLVLEEKKETKNSKYESGYIYYNINNDGSIEITDGHK